MTRSQRSLGSSRKAHCVRHRFIWVETRWNKASWSKKGKDIRRHTHTHTETYRDKLILVPQALMDKSWKSHSPSIWPRSQIAAPFARFRDLLKALCPHHSPKTSKMSETRETCKGSVKHAQQVTKMQARWIKKHPINLLQKTNSWKSSLQKVRNHGCLDKVWKSCDRFAERSTTTHKSKWESRPTRKHEPKQIWPIFSIGAFFGQRSVLGDHDDVSEWSRHLTPIEWANARVPPTLLWSPNKTLRKGWKARKRQPWSVNKTVWRAASERLGFEG